MADAPPPSDAPPPADAPPPNGDAVSGKGPAPVKPAAPRRAGPRPWQGGRFHATTGRGGPSHRTRTILILVAIMLALGGGVAAWVLYPNSMPHPYFTAIALDQYRDTRIPYSRWLARDRDSLRGRGWPGANAFTSQQRNVLVEELRNLGRKQPARQPLVIYLAAYAQPTSDGGLAILPGDASLDDENSWLPLQDVLALVKTCPVERKLLLLDVMQPFADGRAGVLANEAAARAEPIVKKAIEDDPNLLVLCACSPGQTSLATEEMGHSVFVHYLMDGLSGKADGAGDGARDNQVTARELAAYVTANVDRWAWHNRGARQTPMLLGPTNLDFGLSVVDANPTAADAALDRAYPPILKDAWDLRDRWKADSRVQTPSALYRKLEELALRGEDRWRGGGDPSVATEGLVKDHNALPGASNRGESHSLARAAAEGRKPPDKAKLDEPIFQLRQLADMQQRASATPPDPEATAQLEPRKKTFLAAYQDNPFDLCWTVFQAAKDHPETRPPALHFWLSLLAPEGKPPPDYAEIHFLEALAALEVKDPATDWPTAAISAALQLTETAEQVHADLDLCLPSAALPLADWLRKWRDEADDRRQAALDPLLNGKPADRMKTAKLVDAVLGDARGFRALKETLRVLRAALRCRDDALTLLPGFAAYLEHDASREGDWKKAVDQARALRDRLAKPPLEGPSQEWFRETDAQTRSLRGSLDNLLQPVNSHLRTLIPPSPKSGAADAEDMRALLCFPGLASADRLALWAAWRDLAGRLNDETLSPPAGAPAEPLPALDDDRAKRNETDLALFRARLSSALLKLEGGDATKVETALDKAGRSPDDAALLSLSRELRSSWKRLDEAHGH